MLALIRDAPVGQLGRLIFGATAIPYAEEKDGFNLPGQLRGIAVNDYSDEKRLADVENGARSKALVDGDTSSETPSPSLSASAAQIVSWYGSDDSDNPQNWSTTKKSVVFGQLALLTFVGKETILLCRSSIS
jgi:DHA1 family multidrug resistance protein-like MFS transporter